MWPACWCEIFTFRLTKSLAVNKTVELDVFTAWDRRISGGSSTRRREAARPSRQLLLQGQGNGKTIASSDREQPSIQVSASTGPSIEVWKPFPVDELPTVMQQFVSLGAAAIGCDPALIALPASSRRRQRQ